MTITVEQVIATLEEVVAEKGEDYVYPTEAGYGECFYGNEDGSPSCIVGHVLAKLDPIKYQEFIKFESEENGPFGINENGSSYSFDYPNADEWGSNIVEILSIAQTHQDNGATWGEALTAAKSAL